MSDPGTYTVGWICAIATEYIAACEFLDEEHENPNYVSPNDNNSYTVGTVGRHNVVIAVLPDGEYGISSAATVARDMLHSFPNIRIGLMVGIGGGAPSHEHDIRLGDIVVSSPSNGTSGVFQYDYGKTIQDQIFHHTGFLNQPPTCLRTAVNNLKAQYKRKGHRLEAAINTLLQNTPRLEEEYQRPDPQSDRLYKSAVVHPQGSSESCNICGDDPSNLIQRRQRDTKKEDNPAVHYGTIASANQLMRNAVLRDTLANEYSVLCFEMEAAGLMNHFPCLVIRGICDYSDTHKNKDWQGYAAMAAAAYAKDLLSRIPPNRVEAERKIGEIISEMDKIRATAQEMNVIVRDTHAKDHQEKIHSWLFPPDPSTNYNKALRQRHQCSGQWFLQGPAYLTWKTQPNSFLWLQGIPGCGKTVLSSAIIEDLERRTTDPARPAALPAYRATIQRGEKRAHNDSGDKEVQKSAKRQKGEFKEPMESREVQELHSNQLPRSDATPRNSLYFFFDFNDTSKQSLEKAVRSLISQLLSKRKDVQKHVDSLYSSCENGRRQPSIDLLCKTFQDMLQQASEVWIVLDGLDECQTRNEYQNGRLLPWIANLLNSKETNVHLLSTSRPEQDIRSFIEKWARSQNIIPIEGEFVAEDISEYVRTRVRQYQGLSRWRSRPEVQVQIEDTLIQKANGMFRWVSCQLDALTNCLDYKTLRKALESLPRTLDETYARILANVPNEHKHHTVRILQFLTFSERPLRIDEAVDVIAVDTDSRAYFDPENRMPVPEEILRVCSSLVTIVSREITAEIQLAHFSVKEYLTSTRLNDDIAQNFEETTARAAIANVCLAYLLTLDHDLTIKQIRESFPLAQYAARYWMGHAVVAESRYEAAGILRAREFEFFSNKRSYEICYRLYSPEVRWRSKIDDDRKIAPALYYTSRTGLIYSVQMLLDMGADVNTQCRFYGNALQAASLGGHEKIVQILLDKGADVNAQDRLCGNALQAASSEGHEKVVQMLLDKTADVNAQSIEYSSALYAASLRGYEKIVQKLLDKGADVNAENPEYSTALEVASSEGHEKVVQMLLDNGADVNAQGGCYYGNALQAASLEGYEKVVQILLDNGANVNAQGGEYDNALQAASLEGHEKVVQMLLDSGADVNAQGGRYYGNALQAASLEGYEKIVQMLLDKGANVNAQGGEYGNALQAALSEGHEKVVKILLGAQDCHIFNLLGPLEDSSND